MSDVCAHVKKKRKKFTDMGDVLVHDITSCWTLPTFEYMHKVLSTIHCTVTYMHVCDCMFTNTYIGWLLHSMQQWKTHSSKWISIGRVNHLLLPNSTNLSMSHKSHTTNECGFIALTCIIFKLIQVYSSRVPKINMVVHEFLAFNVMFLCVLWLYLWDTP